MWRWSILCGGQQLSYGPGLFAWNVPESADCGRGHLRRPQVPNLCLTEDQNNNWKIRPEPSRSLVKSWIWWP